MYQMNNKTWNIAFVEPCSDMLRRSNGTFTFGMCDRNTQYVYISNNLSGGFLRKVLLHEVTHSAIFSYEIDMSLDQEELFCDLLSTFGDEIIGVVNNVFRALSVVA